MAIQEEANYRKRIVADPDVLVGKPVIKGTRIAVEHVLEQLADSPDLKELFEVFPGLTVDDVRAALEYARALAAGEPVTPTPGSSSRGPAAHPAA